MNIQNQRIALDTNVWIHGLRQDRDHLACAELLENLRAFQIVVSRQVLVELQANLTQNEYRQFWQLINSYAARVEVSWEPARRERFDHYRRLGCRSGDAAVAALTDSARVEVLVTENREFLRNVPGLPFRLVNSAELLAEAEREGSLRRQ
ncbi:MAG: PIN domain-containing protein [Candidatus Binatia bacterium]